MSYKPNKHQTEALLNCATALTEPIDISKVDIIDNMNNNEKDYIIGLISPLQVGDTFTIEHEISIDDDMIFNPYGEDADTTETVTKTFEVVSVEVKKVKEFTFEEIQSVIVNIHALKYRFGFEDWYDKQFGKDSYKANPYVFYVTVKEK